MRINEKITDQVDFETCINDSFKQIEAEMKSKADLIKNSGSTAAIAIITNNNRLYVGNVGDSEVILCNNGIAKKISKDHNLFNLTNIQRKFQ